MRWSGTFRRARTDGPPALHHSSKSLAQSERRALVEDASLVRLARAAVRNHS